MISSDGVYCIYCTSPTATVENAVFPKLFPTDCRCCTDMDSRNKNICRPDDWERFFTQTRLFQERQTAIRHTIWLQSDEIRDFCCHETHFPWVVVQCVVHFKAEFKTGEDVKKKLRFLREERLSPHEVKPDGFVDHFFAKKMVDQIRLIRKILPSSNGCKLMNYGHCFVKSRKYLCFCLEKNFLLNQKDFFSEINAKCPEKRW